MKQTYLKMLTISLFAFFGLIGCLSSEGQAETSTTAAPEAAPATTKTAAPATEKAAPATTETSQFIEGKHYVEIFPEMNTNVKEGQIDVTELFWLGCPHCYTLEPTMEEFVKNKADDIVFTQVPAVLNPGWAFHAKVLYTAKILDPKNEKDLINKLFKEIHDKKNRLGSPKAAQAFFTAQGYSETQFSNTFNSMALNAAMSNAQTISEASQSSSVPTLIINGKYRTSPYMAGGEENLIKIVNMLIEKERK